MLDVTAGAATDGAPFLIKHTDGSTELNLFGWCVVVSSGGSGHGTASKGAPPIGAVPPGARD